MALLDTLRLTIVCLLLSLSCNFQYGFSSTYLNTPVDEFRRFLNHSLAKRHLTLTTGTYDWMWDLIANIWFVGFFFGIWLNPLINDRFGRKVGFLVSNSLSLIASVLRFLAVEVYSPELLFAGRLVASVAMAVGYQCLILFLQECTPTHLRGALSFTSEITYSTMSLLGMFLGMDVIFGKNLPFLLGFAVPPCIIAVLIILPMHETPKFLLLVKKDRKGASKAIRFYHGKSADVDSVLHEIELEAAMDAQQGTVKEILTTPYLRKALLLSILGLQNTTAMWALLLSSTDFLKHANLATDIAEWSSTGMALAYVLGATFGSTFVEKYGRRPMIFIFAAINTLCLALYIVFAALQPLLGFLEYGCLACLILYGFAYGFGVGPITWFLVAELVPQQFRSLVQSMVYAVNTIIVIVLDFSVLPLFDLIQAYAFLPLYILPSIVSLALLYWKLPETQGREIHEIVDELKGRVSRSSKATSNRFGVCQKANDGSMSADF